MYQFLSGIRVIELGHILNGPLAGQVLGDLGADVIKVEALSGDVYRYAGATRNPAMSAAWQATNRNKRSLAIDLKQQQGKQVLQRLLTGANAMIHNMRPSAVARLGFDYESVSAIRPDIVYGFSSGFGQAGPYANYPAIDDLIQAHSGIASLNRDADNKPRLVPMVVADTMSAQMLAQSVLAGLYHQKDTGNGCCIEVPMFETVTSLMLSQHMQGQAFVPPTGDYGYPRVLSQHRGPCKTRDGYVVHGVYRREHWITLFNAIERPDLLALPIMADAASVAQNLDELYRIASEQIFPSRTTAECLELFERIDLACAPVKDFDAIHNDPHLASVGLFREYDHPLEGRMRETRFPVTVSEVSEGNDRPTPTIGQHNKELLAELGYSAADVEQLAQQGVIPVIPEFPASE